MTISSRKKSKPRRNIGSRLAVLGLSASMLFGGMGALTPTMSVMAAVAQGPAPITLTRPVAFASITLQGAMASGLYTINLQTGAATLVANFSTTITDIAFLDGGESFVAVDGMNNLLTFAAPSLTGPVMTLTPTATTPITGLQMGELVVGMDFRPAGNAAMGGRPLFALSNQNRLYRINVANGVATQVGMGQFMSPAPAPGMQFGVDFNPVPDRIRVTSNTGQNFRLNPNNGALVLPPAGPPPDAPLTFAAGDPNTGIPSVVSTAYDRNFSGTFERNGAGAPATTIFVIDNQRDILALQGSINGSPSNPNLGIISTIGSLGVDAVGAVGFDITNPIPDGAVGTPFTKTLTASGGAGGPFTFALAQGFLPPGLTLSSAGVISGTPTLSGVYNFTVRATDAMGGTSLQSYSVNIIGPIKVSAERGLLSLTPPGATSSTLFSVNLFTGRVTTIGGIASTEGPISDIAVPLNDPSTVFGLTTNGRLVTFSASRPGALTGSARITGVVAGETLVGIDFRATVVPGQNNSLFAVGSAGRVYRLSVDLANGSAVAALVGTPTLAAPLAGRIAIDFNPVPDRIRVVTTTNQNLRLNPDNGALAGTDTPLAYAANDINSGQIPNIVAEAYSNNVPQGLNNDIPGAIRATTLYGIDATQGTLVTQGPFSFDSSIAANGPNGGQLFTVAPLTGLPMGVMQPGTLVGFDITPFNSLPAATVGVAYSAQIVPSGGNAPYVNTAPATTPISIGSLPAGLTAVNANNVITISGTPTVGGTFNFTVSTTDSGNNSVGSHPFTINVNANATNVNNLVSLVGTGSASAPTACPAGSGYVNDITLNANLTNNGTSTLNGVFFQVAELGLGNGTNTTPVLRLRTANDFISNCQAGGLVGSMQSVMGPLAPATPTPVTFTIAAPTIPAGQRIRFLVNTFATVSATASNTTPSVQKIGQMAIEVTGVENGKPVVTARFIPNADAPTKGVKVTMDSVTTRK
jgi:hypothetical protein